MKKFSFFSKLDNKIWGDKMEATPYLASFSIIFVGIICAIFTSANILPRDIIGSKPSETALLMTLVVLFCLNIAESIMSANSVGAAVGRSVLVVVSIALSAGIGFLGTIVFFFVLIIGFVLILFSGGIGKVINVRRIGTTFSGRERYEDDRGRTYVSDDGGETVKRE